jgi:hypothetical protein
VEGSYLSYFEAVREEFLQEDQDHPNYQVLMDSIDKREEAVV